MDRQWERVKAFGENFHNRKGSKQLRTRLGWVLLISLAMLLDYLALL